MTPVALAGLAGFVCAYFVLRADLARRRLRIGALALFCWLIVPGLAGRFGVRLLESAAAQWPHPSAYLFRPDALAGSVGAIAVIVALFVLARRRKIRLLVLLDVMGPATALGVAAGRLTSLPAVLSLWSARSAANSPFAAPGSDWVAAIEVVGCAAIFFFLWREGRRAIQFQRPEGIVFSEFLVATSLLGFVVGFWYPSGGATRGLTSTQLASVAWGVAGGGLLTFVLRRYFSEREEHRIIQHVAEDGEASHPEYTPPTPECPHPERWQMMDSKSAEVEVMEFLKSLVITLKPELIVETGTFMGLSALKMAEGLKANGFGRIITCESDPVVFARAKQRIQDSGLAEWIECRNESSLEAQIDGRIDIFFSDSYIRVREQEIRRFLPQISPHGLVLVHDASSHYKIVREAALRLQKEGLLSAVFLSTPRGLVVAQKRAGRE